MRKIDANCSFNGCTGKAQSRGLCMKHYTRWRRYSDPSHVQRVRSCDESDFWLRVSKAAHPKGCWEWQGSLNDRGYGRFTVQRKQIFAHRHSYFLAHGLYPSRLCLHSCDNPRCVNPDHLRDGTHQDNHDDMISRGRERHRDGHEHAQAKLSKFDVLFIRLWRKRRFSLAVLSDVFGVGRTTIRCADAGLSYRNI